MRLQLTRFSHPSRLFGLFAIIICRVSLNSRLGSASRYSFSLHTQPSSLPACLLSIAGDPVFTSAADELRRHHSSHKLLSDTMVAITTTLSVTASCHNLENPYWPFFCWCVIVIRPDSFLPCPLTLIFSLKDASSQSLSPVSLKMRLSHRPTDSVI